MSKIKVNSIEAATGSTITIPSGQTLDISSTTLTLPSTVVTTTGTQTLTNKTIGVSQLSGTLPVANGGTGITALGTASQVLRVNSGATALEFAALSSGKIGAIAHTLYKDTFANAVQTTWTEVTNYNCTITPTAAGSTILAMGHISSGCTNGGPAGHGFTLYRSVAGAANSQIDDFTGNASSSRRRAMVAGASESGSDWTQENGSFNVVDSSSTGLSYTLGQSIKYSMYQWNAATTGNTTVNRSKRDEDGNDDIRSTSSITLIEILA